MGIILLLRISKAIGRTKCTFHSLFYVQINIQKMHFIEFIIKFHFQIEVS